MGCRDTVLPDISEKKHNGNCLTSWKEPDNTTITTSVFSGAVALHLHGNDKLEEEAGICFAFSSAENLEDVIITKKQDQWNAMRSNDWTIFFRANARENLFPRFCCNTHKKHDKV